MAFRLLDDSTQSSQFIVLLVFTPLGIIVTGLRFIIAPGSGRKIGLEDWSAVVATIFSTLANLGALMAISILNGRQISQAMVESPSDFRVMRRWDMSALYCYFVHTFFVKLSVLALYRRIFGINRTYRICIYVLAGAQGILSLIFCIFQALQCRPFSKYFDLTIPGTCKDEGTVILGGEAPNSLIDFAMVILAMVMIRKLQLTSAVKWRLSIVFGLGFLVGLIGFIKIIITYSASVLYAFSMVSLWTCVQMFVSLLCSALPVLNRFLPNADLWSRIVSRVKDYAALSGSWNYRRATGSAGASDKLPPSQDNSARGLA